MGVIRMPLLQAVQNTQFAVTFNNSLYRFVDVFDFRYPGMLPLTCIMDDDAVEGDMTYRACLLRIGDTYMLPVRAGGGESLSCQSVELH